MTCLAKSVYYADKQCVVATNIQHEADALVASVPMKSLRSVSISQESHVQPQSHMGSIYTQVHTQS